MSNIDSIINFIDKFNTLFGFLSLLVSGWTLFMSFRIKNKIDNAKNEQILISKKELVLGELHGYSIFVDKNSFKSINKEHFQNFLIELEESYPILKKKKKRAFKKLNASIVKDDWMSSKRAIINIRTYIERL